MHPSTPARRSASVYTAVLALALLAPTDVHAAAVCSVDQIKTINVDVGSTIATSGCWVPALIATPTAWGAQVCVHRSDCVPVLESIVDELPDCVINGVVVVKDAISEVIAYCEQVLSSSTSDSSGSIISDANNSTDTGTDTANNTATTSSDSNTTTDTAGDNTDNTDNDATTTPIESGSASSSTAADIETSNINSAGKSTALAVAAVLAVVAQIAMTM